MNITKLNRAVWSLLYCCIIVFAVNAQASSDVVDFESDRWVLQDAETVQYIDRTCLIGFAYLKDVEFENGIIEVDIAVNIDGKRTYPGIIFRMQSEENYERFYIRPHRSPYYPDALQYTPVINGIACWQLYSGDGFTAEADIPQDEWFHLKMEIMGKQARVFIGDSERPALVINNLKHGKSRGTIGVFGQKDRTAFFSNFSYTVTDNLQFDPPPRVETPPGMITEWYLSQPFKISQIDIERYPRKEELRNFEWRKVSCEPNGLVDIARKMKRVGREPDCILAKTIVHAAKKETKKYLFGYSDAISIFINGQLLFFGNSAYRQRDPSFLGIIGLHDAVYLPLKQGDNELLVMVAESFGGWGFMFQDGTAVFQHKGVKKTWETTDEFLIPESIVYDSARNVFYISNYDAYNRSDPAEGQFISRVSHDGKIRELKWIAGLRNPTGMTIFQDTLYVVERGNLVGIDIKSEKITNRYPVPQSMFLNDAVVDQKGNIYISDSAKNVIYRFANGSFEEWMKGAEINRPNGLHIHGNTLIIGNNGDNCLKSVDLDTKEINTIVKLGSGVIDGIKTDRAGNYIVSHWEGRVYRVTASGEIVKLLDTTAPAFNSADFEYVIDRGLLVIPTFRDNRVVAYRLVK